MDQAGTAVKPLHGTRAGAVFLRGQQTALPRKKA